MKTNKNQLVKPIQKMKTKRQNDRPTKEQLLEELPGHLGAMQLFDNAALIAAATGKVDLNLLAREELANRGYDVNNQWVGFEKARKQLLKGQYVVVENSK